MPSFARGNNSAIVVSYLSSRKFTEQIFKSAENSASTCRHAPHGVTGWIESATTAIASNLVSPAATAANTAARSAQMVSPKDRFSTLQPQNIWPLAVRSAAPTEK